jgi:hypothetical protein
MTVAPIRIPPDGSKDLWRLSYWSDIALKELPPGSYALQVIATDRVSGVNSSQRMKFSVE